MTPETFIEKWRKSALKERSASQSHFNDLCTLLGEKNPTDADQSGEWLCFEKGAKKTGGGDGCRFYENTGHPPLFTQKILLHCPHIKCRVRVTSILIYGCKSRCRHLSSVPINRYRASTKHNRCPHSSYQVVKPQIQCYHCS